MTVKEFKHNGKKYGYLDLDTGIFRKVVNSRKHKMKMFDAYGIESNVVEQLDALGTKEIRIKEDDTGRVLHASYATFKEKGFEKNFQTPQVFLQLKHFSESPLSGGGEGEGTRI